MIGEHQDRLDAVLLDANLGIDTHKRHELIAILHQMVPVGSFDPAAIDLLQSRDQRKQNRLGLLRAGAEYKERRQVLVAGLLAVIGPALVGLRNWRGTTERL